MQPSNGPKGEGMPTDREYWFVESWRYMKETHLADWRVVWRIRRWLTTLWAILVVAVLSRAPEFPSVLVITVVSAVFAWFVFAVAYVTAGTWRNWVKTFGKERSHE